MFEHRPTPTDRLKLVGQYLTPYAALLVIMGLVFGHPPKFEAALAAGIFVISMIVNIGALVGLEKQPAKSTLIRDIRIGINIVCNFWLIYLLLPYWSEIWMLWLLVVIALAIYDAPETTIFYSYAFACLLIMIAYLRDLTYGMPLGLVLMDVATLVFIGTFVSQLLHAIEPSEPGSAKRLPEKLKVVGFSMTPYAVALVLMGLIFGHVDRMEAHMSIGILSASIAVNLGAIVALERAPSRASMVRDLRVGLNVICNLWLVYILIPYWTEIWMLLLLMIIALAVYGSKETTAVYCGAFSGLLIFIAYLRGLLQGPRLGETLIQAITLSVIGMFINRLVDLIQTKSVAKA
jgi:hypothetical protein